MKLNLKQGWKVMQDVHNTAENLKLYQDETVLYSMGAQLSEWEDLEELKHLQLIFSDQPYWGRELRYFNQAPWWYKNEFEVPEHAGSHCVIRFSNVDYYCKVWFNGVLLGEHEGYSIPFEFCVDDLLKKGEANTLMVKVWSPWDDTVDGDKQERRTFLILRNMVKGTYEHSDTFIQRDVNPIGIYGDVTVEVTEKASFQGRPEITYTLDETLKNVSLNAKVRVTNVSEKYNLRLVCVDKLTKEIICSETVPVSKNGEVSISAAAKNIHLWNTWDRGGQWLYDLITVLEDQNGNEVYRYHEVTGFRKIEMVRNEKETTFYLNNKKLYIRGTSYFPDVYVSAMNKERYKRDLLSIKACGFNLVRVHVHVEFELFYELCTEIGIAVIQDSEYNWAHPDNDIFADRFIDVFLQTVDLLKRHPAIICWICMNEPGLLDAEQAKEAEGDAAAGMRGHSRSMDVNPGPALYKATCEHDPSRPVIKGSFCESDPFSGDSHNYIGSLHGDGTHYREIYGTIEKFNIEYGFDAPPCADSLKKMPKLYRRLNGLVDRLDEIGHYQYLLLKYYTEHYRIQKYSPNSGYVQFLYNDIGPQSFYGIFDWWGLPKDGLDAMLESNMPTGIFLKFNEKLDGIYAVNDLLTPIGSCTVKWVITDGKGNVIQKEEKQIEIGADDIVKVCDLNVDTSSFDRVDVALVVLKDGEAVCSNHYEDLFNMPEHTHGHPSRITHEMGMRLYFA